MDKDQHSQPSNDKSADKKAPQQGGNLVWYMLGLGVLLLLVGLGRWDAVPLGLQQRGQQPALAGPLAAGTLASSPAWADTVAADPGPTSVMPAAAAAAPGAIAAVGAPAPAAAPEPPRAPTRSSSARASSAHPGEPIASNLPVDA